VTERRFDKQAQEFKDGDGRTYYVSAVNEYSCLSIDARLPEIVSVTPALGIGEPIEYTGVRMAGDPAEILGVGDDQEALEEFRRNMEAVRRAEAAVYNDAHSFSQREG
jgi:Tfp pilus assembly protein PilN